MKFLIIAALVVVATAAPQQPSTDKPSQDQPSQAQPLQAQPLPARTFQDQSYQAKTFQAQPYQAQPFQAQPFQAKTFQAQPYQAQLFQALPYQAQPYQAQPFQAQPYQSQPFQAQSYQAKPFQAQAYKPAVVATITKTVTKPVTFQVPVATITKNDATIVEAAKPQYTPQAQYSPTKPSPAQPFVQIIKLEKNLEPSGDYSYFFQADNGIQASEKAVIKAVRDEKNEEHYVPNVEGSYSYTGPDGIQYTVNYVADEFGYRASGAHLPVPPPIPEEIQRSLNFNAQQQPAQTLN